MSPRPLVKEPGTSSVEIDPGTPHSALDDASVTPHQHVGKLSGASDGDLVGLDGAGGAKRVPKDTYLLRNGGLLVDVTHPTYGAVGDGVADDRPAIQAAIDAVNALGGGTVFFPAGTYRVTFSGSDSLALRLRSNVHLRGVGDASVIKLADAQQSFTRIISNAISDPIAHASVAHLMLDGNQANQDPSNEHQHGVFLTGASDCYVKHVHTRELVGDGVHFHGGTSGSIVSHCHHDGWSGGRLGINFAGADNCIAAYNVVRDVLNNWACKMEMDNPGEVRRGNLFIGNEVINCLSGISLTAADSAGACDDMLVANNTFVLTGAPASTGVNLRFTERAKVIGNSIRNGGYGVSLDSGNVDTLIALNAFRDIDDDTSGNAAAIKVGNGSQEGPLNTTVRDNLIANAYRGIYLRNTGTTGVPTRTLIDGNTLTGTKDKAILLVTSQDTKVSNNTVYGGTLTEAVNLTRISSSLTNTRVRIEGNDFIDDGGGTMLWALKLEGTPDSVTDLVLVDNYSNAASGFINSPTKIIGTFHNAGNWGPASIPTEGFWPAHGGLHIPQRTAAPGTPKTSTFYVADGSGWDPLARGAGPYAVFYDGANFKAP